MFLVHDLISSIVIYPVEPKNNEEASEQQATVDDTEILVRVVNQDYIVEDGDYNSDYGIQKYN